MSANTPAKYKLFNESSTKNVSIAVQIDGVDLISSTPLYKLIRYGDPGLTYGEPGIVYGGLSVIPGVRDIFSFEGSSVQIMQVIEPEQGRGSVTQMNLAFIDKDQYMSQVVSPGVLIPEILGREVNVYLGYTQLSYPEDYYRIYRGYVTSVTTQSGMVTLVISDPNVKRRQDIFTDSDQSTTITSPVAVPDTVINVVSTSNMYQQILGPDAAYDPAVIGTYLKIDDEFMSYGPAGITSDTTVTVTRAARGTTAATHDSGATVNMSIELKDSGINLALKLMLSGFNGPWLTGSPIQALGTLNTGPSGLISNAVLLPALTDAKKDFGLTQLDYVTITGSGSGNNGTWQIQDFKNNGGVTNNVILLEGAVFTVEYPTSAVMAFRSKYDTLPVDCGARMTPKDVDVERHEYIQNTFLTPADNQMDFFVDASENAKTFVESNIYLPMGAYSVTRQGRCSMGINRPPIADEALTILSADNILEPDNITQVRATNQRKFWNDIIFNFDFDDSGNPASVFENFDGTSFNLIGLRQQLPIDAPGSRTSLGAADQFQKRSDLMLTRFSRGAAQITLKTDWGTGNQIEAGDIVALKDDGSLQITNFATGERNNDFQLYEVINRTLQIRTGDCDLTLINGIQSKEADRYGVIAPSSIVGVGSTGTNIQIIDSYGFAEPGDEVAKWRDYIGDHLQIHNDDFSTVYQTILTGVDETNGKFITVSPAITAPTSGMIVDFDNYSANIDDDRAEKLINCFLSHDAPIVTGISNTSFTVSSGDLSAIFPGAPVIVHNTNFSVESIETTILTVVGTTITVTDDLGFTPNNTMFASLLGFPDEKPCYRYL